MARTLIFLLALAPAGAAHAQAVQIKPLGEARLRYETVDQDGLAANADALTLRLRGEYLAIVTLALGKSKMALISFNAVSGVWGVFGHAKATVSTQQIPAARIVVKR